MYMYYRTQKSTVDAKKDIAPTQIQIDVWENDGGKSDQKNNNFYIFNGIVYTSLIEKYLVKYLKIKPFKSWTIFNDLL